MNKPVFDIEIDRDAERAAFERANMIMPRSDRKGFYITDDQAAGNDAQRSGFRLAGALAPAADDPYDQFDGPDVTLKGAGWIQCADGKWVCDRGGSIYVKGYPVSGAQMQKAAELALGKGWTTVTTWCHGWNQGGVDHELSNAMNSLFARHGLTCIEDHKACGSFNRACKSGLAVWGNKQINDHWAAIDRTIERSKVADSSIPHNTHHPA